MTYKVLLQRSSNDLDISLRCIAIFRKDMDFTCSTKLLYVSKVRGLFANQWTSKLRWECEVDFDWHLKIQTKIKDLKKPTDAPKTSIGLLCNMHC